MYVSKYVYILSEINYYYYIIIQIIEYIVMSINTQLYNVQLHIYIHLGLPIARLQYFHNMLDIIPIELN